jgi:hypothetical protein
MRADALQAPGAKMACRGFFIRSHVSNWPDLPFVHSQMAGIALPWACRFADHIIEFEWGYLNARA